jgi:sugar phosphate isomerase/epimerase
MKIGLYSITYRGVWYRGRAVDLFSLVRLAKQQGWEGLELDAERPHAAPMDLSADGRKRLRDLAGECGLELCAVSPNCDLSSPVPVQREAMLCYVRECIKLARDLGSPPGVASRFTTASRPTTTRTVTTSTGFGKATAASLSSSPCASYAS